MLAVIKRPLINKYGVNAILAPIMKDIGELEQDGGYPFNLNGNSKCFSGTIAFVCGLSKWEQDCILNAENVWAKLKKYQQRYSMYEQY